MVYSTYIRRVAAVVVAGAFVAALVPLVSQAQVMSAGAFCTNLEQLQERVQGSLGERAERVQARHQERVMNYEDGKQERLMKLEQVRVEADGYRDGKYEQLQVMARTQEQVAAANSFEENVEALVRDRRALIDAAIDEFEAVVEELDGGYNADFDSYVADAQAAVEGALADAEEGCNGSASATEVRNQLRDRMQEIRSEYAARREGFTYREQFQQAREARNAAFQEAWDGFSMEFEKEKEKLRGAFDA